MEPTCIKNTRISARSTTPLIDDDAELFNADIELSDDDGYVTDANGNVFDKNGKLIGYTWEEVAYAIDQQLSEAYGVDFHKVARLREAGVLKDKDVTNELLLSPEFKYEPYPGFKPTRPQKPVTDNPEWDAAMEEVVAALENDDEDEFENESENKYAKSMI
jgi:hypothetical protein